MSALFVAVGVLRFEAPPKQQPYHQHEREKYQEEIGKIIQPVAEGIEIMQKIIFRCPQLPIGRPFTFEAVKRVGDRYGRSGGRDGNGRGKIKERDFRELVDRGGNIVVYAENLTEIIRDRQAKIPNTLNRTTEGVREQQPTGYKPDYNCYGYVVPIIDFFHT